MIDIFYILSIAFIWSNAYYFLNRKVLETRFEDKKNTSKVQLVYYYTKLLYWIWLSIGLFTELNTYFVILGVLSLLKFPLYHLNKKIYVYYIVMLPLLNIITMVLLNIKPF